mmetsp:Transcript_27574/g.44863  ORF Transcript_27574/g.44863 Transcript_27574/m.44863 type:complete len:107 (+) Transcript_27574:33-353(+)
MLRIGLTGGIGSGKSTVGQLLVELWPEEMSLLVMDDVAKELMNSNAALRKSLQDAFGKDVYTGDGAGSLDRAKLAAIVFADPQQLNLINSLVHPPTFDFTARRAQE